MKASFNTIVSVCSGNMHYSNITIISAITVVFVTAIITLYSGVCTDISAVFPVLTMSSIFTICSVLSIISVCSSFIICAVIIFKTKQNLCRARTQDRTVANMLIKETMVAQVLTAIISVRSIFTSNCDSNINSDITIISTFIAVAGEWAVFHLRGIRLLLTPSALSSAP